MTVLAYIGGALLALLFAYLLGRMFAAGWFRSKLDYINSIYKRTTNKGVEMKGKRNG